MKKIYFAVLPTLYAASAQANGFLNVQSPNGGGVGGNGVPEISALEGTAALAAVAAVLLFAWERRRRAS